MLIRATLYSFDKNKKKYWRVIKSKSLVEVRLHDI
jgi:hypothetical protein